MDSCEFGTVNNIINEQNIKSSQDILIDTDNPIDFSLMHRALAIIVFNNKIYTSENNHQDCILQIGQEVGMILPYLTETTNDIEGYCKLTDDLFRNNDAYGFDLFEDKDNIKYLSAHYHSNLIACYDIISQYARENNYNLCVADDITSSRDYIGYRIQA